MKKTEIITMIALLIAGFMAGRLETYPIPYLNFTAQRNDLTLLFWGLAVVGATLALETVVSALKGLNKYVDREGAKLEKVKVLPRKA